MPFANVNGVRLNYLIIGDAGPVIALQSGARRGMGEVKGLGELLADAGYRVLLNDRRNTGNSEVSIDGEGSEFEIWAADLLALLKHLNIEKCVVGGSSSGCRLSTIFTLRYPQVASALIMMRVTGGLFAVERLSYLYYTQYIETAERGGMAAVCETDHFKDLISRDVKVRDTLMSLPIERFVAVMKRWRDNLELGRNTPILGATEAELHSIKSPVLVLPGNDKTHSLASGRLAASLIAGAELHELRNDQLDADLISLNEWSSDAAIARAVVDFLRRRVIS